MRKRGLGFVMGLLAVLIAGCQNPYEEFFREDGYGTKSAFIRYGAEPAKVMRGSAPTREAMNKDQVAMWEAGYGVIGISGFIGDASGTGPEPTRQQATKIGAAIALFYTHQAGTQLQSVPVVTNTFTTTHTPYGPVTSTGTGFSSIPVSVSTYDFTVAYYGKLKPGFVGILAENLDAAHRQKLGSNKGALILGVVRGSPAFEADILPGDILTAIDGRDVVDQTDIRNLRDVPAGQPIRLSLWREGKRLTKVVTVPRTSR